MKDSDIGAKKVAFADDKDATSESVPAQQAKVSFAPTPASRVNTKNKVRGFQYVYTRLKILNLTPRLYLRFKIFQS